MNTIMKLLFTYILFSSTILIAQNPNVRISDLNLKAHPSGAYELKIGFDLITSQPYAKRPIIALYLLYENENGTLGYYTFFNWETSGHDWNEFYNQNKAVNHLRRLAGLGTAKSETQYPTSYDEQNELLKKSSINNISINRENLRRVEIKGLANIFGDTLIASRIELWQNGEIIAEKTWIDHRSFAKRKIPNDWFHYAKYPDHVLYTGYLGTISERPSQLKSHLPNLK